MSAQKITVTQKPYYTLSSAPDLIMLEACYYYNPQQVSIRSNTNWTVSWDPNLWWLTVSPTSGTGDGVIMVSAYDNIEIEPRQALLNFTLPDGQIKNVTIMQSGGTWVFAEPSSREVGYETGSSTFMVNAFSGGWIFYCANIYESVDWITVEPMPICGPTEVVVYYSENKLSQKRTGEICFIANCGYSMCVTVTQDGAPVFLEVTPITTQLGYQEGSNADLSISSSIEWSATTSESWLTLSQTTGAGDGKITMTAQANSSLISRTATINITGTNASPKTVAVTQAGAPPFLEISVSSLPLSSAEGASGTFDITSNTNWTAISSESWLVISNTGAFGNATITVTAQKNPTINTRNATVTIKATDLPDKTVIVNQVGAATAITEINNNHIKIYPNPANNYLFFEGLSEDTQVSIYDINGRQLLNRRTKNNFIDISTLRPAVYTLILLDDGGEYSFRFVKD